MGTRADYYLGRDPETMVWLGSTAWDGNPEAVFGDTPPVITERAEWLEWIANHVMIRSDYTNPERGWPWPWDDSGTTDYAYAWCPRTGEIYVSNYGRPWVSLVLALEGTYDDEGEKVAFPNMAAIKNIRWDPEGSGIFIVRIPGSDGG